MLKYKVAMNTPSKKMKIKKDEILSGEQNNSFKINCSGENCNRKNIIYFKITQGKSKAVKLKADLTETLDTNENENIEVIKATNKASTPFILYKYHSFMLNHFQNFLKFTIVAASNVCATKTHYEASQ